MPRALNLSTLIIVTALFWAVTAAAAESSALITHGPRNRQQVALTFDICQTPGKPTGLDRPLIDILRREKTPATFFIGGDWMRTHPQELAELAAEPLFELANHSWSHPDLRHQSAVEIAAQVERTAAELSRQTGRRGNLFRLPFGYYDAAVLKALTAARQRVIQWDVVSGDPDPLVSADKMVAALTRNIRPGSIVIMHANGRGRHTAAALPEVLTHLHRQRLQPVTVSTLLAE